MVKPSIDKVYTATQTVRNSDDTLQKEFASKHPEDKLKNLIIWLDKLSCLSESQHLKSRYVHIVIKLRLSMGHKPPVCLGVTNTFE